MNAQTPTNPNLQQQTFWHMSVPERLRTLCERLERILTDQGWLTSAQCLRRLGMAISEDNRRTLRDVVAVSGGRIASGPGTPGYALTRQLTPEQIGVVNGMRTQAAAMLRRRNQILRCWHKNKSHA